MFGFSNFCRILYITEALLTAALHAFSKYEQNNNNNRISHIMESWGQESLSLSVLTTSCFTVVLVVGHYLIHKSTTNSRWEGLNQWRARITSSAHRIVNVLADISYWCSQGFSLAAIISILIKFVNYLDQLPLCRRCNYVITSAVQIAEVILILHSKRVLDTWVRRCCWGSPIYKVWEPYSHSQACRIPCLGSHVVWDRCACSLI